MQDDSDAAELEAYGNLDITEGLFEYLILEGMGVALTLAACAIIVASSARLAKGNRMPGARLILLSVTLTVTVSLLSVLYAIVLDIDENHMVDAFLNALLGGLFLVGALGFFRLSRHVIAASGEKDG